MRCGILLLGAFLTIISPSRAQEAIGPEPAYREAAGRLGRLIEAERAAKGIPAVSVALVADGRVVWSAGFGKEDPAGGTPATAETEHRVGSVSKLFTDIALMQLVERGEVDLDAPVRTYLPTFGVKNFTDKPITLRQILSHRSGITREPPVGHYFDPTGPSQSDTVASLNATTIVYEPTTRTKYSNAAIAVAGQVVATLRKEPFEDSVKRTVLGPMGMDRSDFRLTPEVARTFAKATMWSYDGKAFAAPTFPLGTIAAGNLYSTVNDLGKFLIVLSKEGDGPGGRVLKAETLREMYKVQFARDGAKNGFGLGFMISEFEGSRRVGHSGAVYGFATDVQFLPEEGLGVAVVATKDCANASSKRIAEESLRCLLAAKGGKLLPEIAITESVPEEVVERSLAGVAARRGAAPVSPAFRRGALWDRAGSLGPGGADDLLRLRGDHLVHDGFFRIDLGDDLRPKGGPADKPATHPMGAPPAPPRGSFEGLIGEYGWDHNVLYVYERGGKLRVLIEWFFHYPLIGGDDPDRFHFEDTGLYMGERALFARDGSGRATQVKIGDVVFPRRPIPGEDGKTFRIRPLRPVEELRAEALKATPPKEEGDFRETDLADLATLDPSIKLDIRYAGEDNFLGAPFYSSARAFLQKDAAAALANAAATLKEDGLGLLIHDAYRPWYVTKMFWDATPEANHNFVANPREGSKHNRGCAVDLSLYDLKTGEPVRMVGGYDEFSDRSNPDYPGGTGRQRWHRDRLRRAMEGQGFSVNEFEWWHFDYKDWPKYRIGNARFEDLAK